MACAGIEHLENKSTHAAILTVIVQSFFFRLVLVTKIMASMEKQHESEGCVDGERMEIKGSGWTAREVEDDANARQRGSRDQVESKLRRQRETHEADVQGTHTK